MPEIDRITRTRAAAESAMSTDGTGTIGNFFDVRANEITAPQIAPEVIPNEPLRSFREQRYAAEYGFSRGEISLSADLVSTNNPATSAATVTKTSQSKLLEQIAGGYVAGGSSGSGAGSAVASGASTTGITVTGTQGARFDKLGILVAVETGVGTNRYEVTSIKTRSTDALTFSRALSFTPAVGARVLNGQGIYPTDQPIGSLQWLIERGRLRDHIYLYLGCNGNLGITWPLGNKLTWSTTQQVSRALQDDEIATPQGGSPMSIFTLDGSGPVVGVAGSISFEASSSTARTLPKICEFSFDPGINRTPVESFNTDGGRCGWECGLSTASAKITLPHLDETYDDARAAGTPYRLIAQAGVVGGKIIALELPYCQITKVTPKPVGGMLYDELELMLLPDGSLADQSDDVRRRQWMLTAL